MPLHQAVEALQIPPRTFRQLIEEYGDLVEGPRPLPGGQGQDIPHASVELFRRILEWRGNGIDAATIRRRLTDPSWTTIQQASAEVAATLEPQANGTQAESAEMETIEAASGAATPAQSEGADSDLLETPEGTPDPTTAADDELAQRQAALLSRLERLTQELARSEEKRVEDRDRMLTALMRTQQEIQHLRYELATRASRKDRKKGFFSRLFGA